MRRYLPFVIIGAVFLIAVSSGYLLVRHRLKINSAQIAKPAFGKPGAEPPHFRGSATAPVTLEEFGDFECPPCGTLSSVLKELEDSYGAKLLVIFREHPLVIHHPHARDAACAAEAAGLQNRFWQMHDLLYQNRFSWTSAVHVRTEFNTLATRAGLDLDRFKRDMDSEEVKKRIAADEERAASIQVDRTPTIFINGTQIPSTSFTKEGLRAAIDAALTKKTK